MSAVLLLGTYRVSQEECAIFRESVPYVKHPVYAIQISSYFPHCTPPPFFFVDSRIHKLDDFRARRYFYFRVENSNFLSTFSWPHPSPSAPIWEVWSRNTVAGVRELWKCIYSLQPTALSWQYVGAVPFTFTAPEARNWWRTLKRLRRDSNCPRLKIFIPLLQKTWMTPVFDG
jgi:hypothetical protein